MSPGDVYWIEFPDSSGHEQIGRRPAVLLQDDSVCVDLPLAIVVPFTTAQRATRFEGVVQIEPDGKNGLRRTSYALVFQIRAIDRRAARDQIGAISSTSLREIHLELDRILGKSTVNEPDSDIPID